jgi:VIT1/CCC1 family predicted Fe2+/Mn2+ transporter
MGAAKALVTARSALRSGVEMVVIGTCAAVVTNIVGRLLGSYAVG